MKSSPFQRKVLALAVLLTAAGLAVWLLTSGPVKVSSEAGGAPTATEGSASDRFAERPAAGPRPHPDPAPPTAQVDAFATATRPGIRADSGGARKKDTGLSAEGRALLREQMRRDFDGLEPVYHADGSISLDLQGRFMHVTAVVTSPDGENRVQCFSDAEALLERIGSEP